MLAGRNFALLIAQVVHIWAFLQLEQKPLWMTTRKWQRLWVQRRHLLLRSIQDHFWSLKMLPFYNYDSLRMKGRFPMSLKYLRFE